MHHDPALIGLRERHSWDLGGFGGKTDDCAIVAAVSPIASDPASSDPAPGEPLTIRCARKRFGVETVQAVRLHVDVAILFNVGQRESGQAHVSTVEDPYGVNGFRGPGYRLFEIIELSRAIALSP